MVKNKHLLDTPSSELAYWIGYISADGCITKCGGKVTFCIQQSDVSMLENLVDYFGITNAIRQREVFDKRTNKIYYQTNLQITDTAFVKKLQKYNLTSNKSKIFTIPEIFLKDEYFFSFLKGLLDGDGNIYVKGNTTEMHFISTKECVQQIKDYLGRFYCFWSKIIPLECVANSCNVYRIVFYGEATSLLHLIYKDGYILRRKYDKYQESILAKSRRKRIRKIKKSSITYE